MIRRNSGRIWDIGGLEYTQVAEFLDGCNRDQLEEIENNSTVGRHVLSFGVTDPCPQHIKKDTDWLWERFVVEDYPVYYGSCRERKGQQRTSGWRRMYQVSYGAAIIATQLTCSSESCGRRRGA